jgi:acetoin utilization deacetylase AcuC-like enzyme
MATAVFTHADGLRHETPEGHPERIARLEHVQHALAGLDTVKLSAPEASDETLRLCHPQAYIDRIVAAEPDTGLARLDSDTWMSPGSVAAARRAAGAAVAAVDAVLDGMVANAFCAMRPPGHHAERETPMGFCLFGSAALAARHGLENRGLSRVAVVDFDVHHGNGTQDLLWDEARALFFSSHQMPLWPGSGRRDERGAHDQVVNLPLAPGSGGAEMRAIYEAEVLPRLEAFAPELLVISAGFDAHRADPLAQLVWEVEDFVWVTRALCAAAAKSGAPVVSVLEGGYDLEALAASARAHVEVLMEAGA